MSRQARRSALIGAAALMLPGCSLSMPMLGDGESPATTGSIAAPVRVQQPLPATLAYSDAAKIGQTAVAALVQVDKGRSGDWVNAATGSSGTIEDEKRLSDGCQGFSTMVTSIGGVHSYSGRICRADGGSSTVQIDAPA